MDRKAVPESVAVGPPFDPDTHPWMLQFGGHHLTLNIAIAVRQGALTPTLTGAQPAAFKLNVKTIRPREGEQQGARLIAVPGREAARPGGSPYSPYTVADLVPEPGQDDKKIAPEGLKALRRTSHGGHTLGFDRRMGRHHPPIFCRLPHGSDEGGAELDVVCMEQPDDRLSSKQWHCVLSHSGSAPRHEYALQDEEPTNHVHTIYCDPANDCGPPLTN
jgi:hypothetical protein